MTARERNLAYGFITILVAGGAFLGVTQLQKWKQRVDDAEYELVLRQTEAEILLGQKDLWLERGQWITSKQPLFTSKRDADTEVNRLVQESMAHRDVDVVQIQPSDSSELPGLFASTMLVQGKTEFTNGMGWIYDLQKPENFVSIPSITITPDEEDTTHINISLVLQKWYRKSDS